MADPARLFGCDLYGRDLFSLVFGGLFGTLIGYASGRADAIGSRGAVLGRDGGQPGGGPAKPGAGSAAAWQVVEAAATTRIHMLRSAVRAVCSPAPKTSCGRGSE
jgi:hypothetical protein